MTELFTLILYFSLMDIILKSRYTTDNPSRVRELQREIIAKEIYNFDNPRYKVCFGNLTNELITLIGKEETFNFLWLLKTIYG